MLRLEVNGKEYYDEENESFVYPEKFVIELEHSLVSLSKWESIHQKVFLNDEEKTDDEIVSYVSCMIQTPGIDEEVLSDLSPEEWHKITNYMGSDLSATTINERQKPDGKPEVMTSELIYYWLVALNIPFEAENWHLSRLFKVIRIASIKNDPNPKKQNRADMIRERNELNEKRKRELGTTG